MSPIRSNAYLISLVNELRRLPNEAEWVEFKGNDANPQVIGEYISALANSAALIGKSSAYIIWGIHNVSHRAIGTDFVPASTKIGNEELENWLLKLLHPRIEIAFHQCKMGQNRMVILEVMPALYQPVRFSGEEYIRVGSYKKKLKEFPEKERELWQRFRTNPFETGIAQERVSDEEVLSLLKYESYFELLEMPVPKHTTGVLEALRKDRILSLCDAGGWNITNLGAICFARTLETFPTISRKAMRVIEYKGSNRVETKWEQLGKMGYASGFEGLVKFINDMLPSNEVIKQALRTKVSMYPQLAVRELVANALIHQDFAAVGAGPMVEVFDDRVEITNPGIPLVETNRFLDSPPVSRNEVLASLMRRARICEERGSGIDKVVFEVELYQLPAPVFEVREGFTRSVLFALKPLSEMEKADRIRACYLHTCLRYVMNKPATNTTLRERFGIPEQNAATASRMLSEAVDAGFILVQDPSAGTRNRRYLPFWARPSVA